MTVDRDVLDLGFHAYIFPTGALWSLIGGTCPFHPKAGVDLLSYTRLSDPLCDIAPSQSAIPRAVRRTAVTESWVGPLTNGTGHGPCQPTASLLTHREPSEVPFCAVARVATAVVLARRSVLERVRRWHSQHLLPSAYPHAVQPALAASRACSCCCARPQSGRVDNCD